LPIARGQPIFLDQAADLVLDIPANGHKPGTGENFNTLRDFCDERGLSKHGHSVTWEHEWYQVFMFAVEEHAEIFRKEFGGERMQPSEKARARTGRGGRKARTSREPRALTTFLSEATTAHQTAQDAPGRAK
jgi:hypothetical protein